ncbi:MAG: site-specific integrase [Flavobacteriaceae bacterium]|nr:site-specific integrase [Flavobacteriaceae bacterium]
MNNSIYILFYIKKSKADKLGKANIYLRITIAGKRAEVSMNRKVTVNKWSSEFGKVKGSSTEARELNHYMESIRSRMYKTYQDLILKDEIITANKVRNSYLGKENKPILLLKIFQDHNDKVERLIGKDFTAGTAERYRTAKNHIEDYIKLEYNADDIPVKDVNHKFITGLEYYLKTERNCSHNTAIKYITNFKKIIRIAYANDWISKDPFFNWKARLKIIDREFLTKEEIQIMIEKELFTKRLDQVKDIFIFCCFTGLAYADVKKLSNADIVLGIDGERWIKTKRSKTDTRSNIPILPTAQVILDKYVEYSKNLNTNKLLPVLSNQKMNAYLKEIADLCGIDKNLTFHLARHTFATTVTLSNGVPIESVSKMLGHKSLKTTQHYAKILDRKVSEDMAILKSKLKTSIEAKNAN